MDDNATNRDLLVRMLERQRLTTAIAEDGERALAVIGLERFDLVLLDVLMPRMTGHQVLERLKASDTLRHIPVIVISSTDDLESISACIQLGAEDYLPRPFNSTILRARIEASLERKRLHDEEALARERLAGSMRSACASWRE